MTFQSPLSDPDQRLIRLRHFIREHLTIVPIIAPPAAVLEPAIEYSRTARFVALYQSKGSEEIRYDDGRNDEPACALGFWTLCGHQSIQRAGMGMRLGGQGIEATHSLIIDRLERRLYFGKSSIATQFVNTQDRIDVEAAWTPDRYRPSAAPSSQLDLFAFDPQARVIDLDARQRRATDLKRWLDDWATPPVQPPVEITLTVLDDTFGLRVFVKAHMVATVIVRGYKPPLIMVEPPFKSMQAMIETSVAAYLEQRASQ